LEGAEGGREHTESQSERGVRGIRNDGKEQLLRRLGKKRRSGSGKIMRADEHVETDLSLRQVPGHMAILMP